MARAVQAETYDVDNVKDPGPQRRRGSGLRPFDSTPEGRARAAEASRKAAAARKRNRAALVAAHRTAIEALTEVSATVERDQLGTMAVAAAMHMMGEVTAGRVKVKDPAEWVRVLVDIARLEEGQYTTATLAVHLDNDTALARVKALRDEARRALVISTDVDEVNDIDPACATADTAAHSE